MKRKWLHAVVLPGLALLIAGCTTTPPTLDPIVHPEVFGPLKQIDEQLGQARTAGKADSCAAAYQQVVQLRKKAEATYWSCRTAEAAKLANEALEKAKALCPAVAKAEEKVVVKQEPPAPTPTPVAAPVVVEKDTDGDGILDKDDKCPGTPRGAKVDGRGCWTIPMTHFDLNRASIRPVAIPDLNAVAGVLKQNPGLKIEVQGYTDTTGTKSYNQGLSERRAKSVKKYLVGQGIETSRISTVGFGVENPITSNATRKGREQNRRVQFKPLTVGSKPVN
jgi:outer membrane protein OmpA-like peptidoglycan-associated protein